MPELPTEERVSMSLPGERRQTIVYVVTAFGEISAERFLHAILS
jgi:hypothetical protein